MYAAKMPENTAHTRNEQTLTSDNIFMTSLVMFLDVQVWLLCKIN